MNKVDVVLIYPPTEFVDNLKQDLHNYRINNKKVGVWPPLGLLYLSAVLDKKNISSRVIDAFVLGLSLEQIIKEIARYSPKIVGISVTTLQIRGAVQLGEAIKRQFKNVKIIIGGPHISVDNNFVRQFKCFDVGITGEAEISFVKVVEKILNNMKVPKMVFGELPLDLDALPFPSREKIKIKDYFDVEKPMCE